MRRLALGLVVASLGGALPIGAVSGVAGANVHPAKTTCTIFDVYSVGNIGRAVCAYGTGTVSVSNSGLTVQWANGQTSTLSAPSTFTQLRDRKCPVISGDTLLGSFKFIGGTVTSGPLVGSSVRVKFCEYSVNDVPGVQYAQNRGLVHL